MDKSGEQNTQKQQQQRFPITKPQICSSNPKFPFRDIRHYTDPCCDFPKQCQQMGSIAKLTLDQHQNPVATCHSPEFPTSHPWFAPSP